MFSRLILPVACSLILTPFFPARVSASAQLPQTRAVQRELAALQRECDHAITLIGQMRSTVKQARDLVDQSIDATTAIRELDRRLVKLIDRLKPYKSVPKVRSIARQLAKNLQRIESQLHDLRKKTDPCEERWLRPARQRLRSLEQALAAADTKVRSIRTAVGQWDRNLDSVAVMAGSNRQSAAALEFTCATARPQLRQAIQAIATMRSQTEVLGDKLNDVARFTPKFQTVHRSIDQIGEKMGKGETMVANLDKVLGKRLTIKLPFSKKNKSISFSVREILEKPGELLDVVAKPLEKLADKILQPVLGKMNLEIPTPDGIADLDRHLVSIQSDYQSMLRAVDTLQSGLSRPLDQQLRWVQSESQRSIKVQSNPNPIRQPPTSKPPTSKPPAQQPPKRQGPAMFLTFG